MTEAEQVISVFAGVKGYLDDLELNQIKDFERDFFAKISTSNSELIEKINSSGVLDDDPYGEYPVRGVIAGVFTAIFYSAFLIIYRFANRELAPAVNLQFDSTAGCALGLLILSFLPLKSIYVEPIDFETSLLSCQFLRTDHL